MGIACELLEPESDFLKCSVGFPFMRSKSKYEFSVIFDTSHLSGEEEVLSFLVTAQSGNLEHLLHDNTLVLTVPLKHEVDSSITGVVSPSSFVYGESVEASQFIQLEDFECHFQPLNFTLQYVNIEMSVWMSTMLAQAHYLVLLSTFYFQIVSLLLERKCFIFNR
uniref:Integrin alpha-9 n=1 Tax=Sphaerodactylus townsendi TaxID=933632 RepID=A0ACB8FU27_9SAUR